MSERAEKAAEWVYRGLWRVLSDWFRVPEHPPTLPAAEGEFRLSFHPSRRYLSYMKLYFWILLVVIDLAILAGWIVVCVADAQVGMLLALPALAIIVVPDIIAYVMIHLRYDTMWYVMTDRSLRCRRGIWVIIEHTITFENVQNVHVRRGPVQYFFGISTVVVETAGASEGEGKDAFAVGNKAIMQGIDNPKEIRELIMERVDRSCSAGLGDEPGAATPPEAAWGTAHRSVLREILEEVRALG